MQRARKVRVFVLLAPGFTESDVSVVTRTLRRLGISVVIVGSAANPVRRDYNLSLTPDRPLREVRADRHRATELSAGTRRAYRFDADFQVDILQHRRGTVCGVYAWKGDGGDGSDGRIPSAWERWQTLPITDSMNDTNVMRHCKEIGIISLRQCKQLLYRVGL